MEKMKSKKIKFCPKCGSEKVVRIVSDSMAFGVPQQLKCQECGFKSDLFPEVSEDKLKVIQKEIVD